MSRNARLSLAVSAAFGLVLLGGCATPTTYHPASAAADWSDGYHETRLEDRRWRVVFRGNILTSREAVEAALLFRSAELTRQQGYDWFLAVNRDTEAHDDLVLRDPLGAWGGAWSPQWRVAYGGAWRDWEQMRPERAVEVTRVTAYEAIAEIVMGQGAKPDDPRAYDAASVLDTLQPQVLRPGFER